MTATIAVSPGQTLFVEVGGNGATPALSGPSVGGFNGGNGANGANGPGGGGASVVRTVARTQAGTAGSRLVTASGAGGGAAGFPATAGAGDVTGTGAGADGVTGAGSSGGGGASATGGGTAGTSAGTPGALGSGGAGASSGSGSSGAVASATGLAITSPPAGTAPSITLTWTVPVATAPDTRIDQSPSHKVTTATKKARVSFAFSSPTAGASFQCSLDGAAYATCASPYSTKLKTGKHSFAVRALVAGVSDPTPATAAVKVKRRRR